MDGSMILSGGNPQNSILHILSTDINDIIQNECYH